MSEEVQPDEKHNWINVASTDFSELVPLFEDTAGKRKSIFGMRTNGINTARDEWVYDLDERTLLRKMGLAIDVFNADHKRFSGLKTIPRDKVNKTLKWSEGLFQKLGRQPASGPNAALTIDSEYRPFIRRHYYADPIFSDRLTSLHSAIFGSGLSTRTRSIAVSAPALGRNFYLLATTRPCDWHFVGDTQIYAESTEIDGVRRSNITEWALEQFRKRYEPKKASASVTDERVFFYVYGVLHDPAYREKYALDLRREFPRVPFYSNFVQWSDWGKTLFALHTTYDTVSPSKLKRTNVSDETARRTGMAPKCILKAEKTMGKIVIDSETTLEGVPVEAWGYRLGNRSALEWVLDQYKEGTPKDPTIREKFDTYRFAGYKEKVIDLLQRVTTVSVETQKIVEAMRKAPR